MTAAVAPARAKPPATRGGRRIPLIPALSTCPSFLSSIALPYQCEVYTLTAGARATSRTRTLSGTVLFGRLVPAEGPPLTPYHPGRDQRPAQWISRSRPHETRPRHR